MRGTDQTSGALFSNAAAPVSSLTRPAAMKNLIGHSLASVTACSWVFMPPFVRPISLPIFGVCVAVLQPRPPSIPLFQPQA